MAVRQTDKENFEEDIYKAFSEKARVEMEVDGITEMDVAESILSAMAIVEAV
jgi:hypothetical protein